MPLVTTRPFFSAAPVPFTIASASYDSIGTDLPRPGDGYGMFFKPDGTRLYVLRSGPQYEISQVNLSTPWDLSTVSDSGRYLYLGVSYWDQADGVSLNSDGTKIYNTRGTIIYEHTLSTAWQLPNASAPGTITGQKNLASISGISSIEAHAFSDDGTQLYVANVPQGVVQRFALTVPWDADTIVNSPGGIVLSIPQITARVAGLKFSADGTKLFILNSGADMYQYNFGTPWDLTTASYSGISFPDVNPLNSGNATGLAWKTDGTKFYSHCLDAVPGFDVYQFSV